MSSAKLMSPESVQGKCRGPRVGGKEQTPFPAGVCIVGGKLPVFARTDPPLFVYTTNRVSKQLKTAPENFPNNQCNVIYTGDLKHVVTLVGSEHSDCNMQSPAAVILGLFSKGA